MKAPAGDSPPAELAELYRVVRRAAERRGRHRSARGAARAPLRVYVETDPVTAELRLANGDEHTREAFAAHHAIATYGENYGAPTAACR